jgi:hypothetical protein
MGEEVVVEGERIGAAFLDRFVAEPPGPGECDYLAVGPNPDA